MAGRRRRPRFKVKRPKAGPALYIAVATVLTIIILGILIWRAKATPPPPPVEVVNDFGIDWRGQILPSPSIETEPSKRWNATVEGTEVSVHTDGPNLLALGIEEEIWRLTHLNLVTGKADWSVEGPLPGSSTTRATVTVGNRLALVTVSSTSAASITAIDAKRGIAHWRKELAPSDNGQLQVLPGPANSVLISGEFGGELTTSALDAVNGVELWASPGNWRSVCDRWAALGAPSAETADPLATGFDVDKAQVLDPRTGDPKWSSGPIVGLNCSLGIIATFDNQFKAIELRALASGEISAEIPTGSAPVVAMPLADDRVLTVGARSDLPVSVWEGLETQSARVWQRDVECSSANPLAVSSLRLAFQCGSGPDKKTMVVSLEDGIEILKGHASAMDADGKVIYLLANGALRGWDIGSGAELWAAPMRFDPRSSVLATGSGVVVADGTSVTFFALPA